MPDEPEVSPRQKAVARYLAGIVREVVVESRREVMHEDHAARTSATTQWLEQIEQEMVPISRQLVEMLGDTSELPEGIQTIIGLIQNPEHQFDALSKAALWILGFAGIAATGARIGSQVWANQLWSQNTNIPISPADAADMVVRNLQSEDEGYCMAAQSGINKTNFHLLVALTGEPPGPMDMLSLWRRGLIDTDFLEQAIRYSRIKDIYIPAIEELAHSYMTPADTIELAVKGLVDEETGATMYETAGGIKDQYDILFKAAGNAIGNEAALNLFNHKLIDKECVYEVFGRSRMNPIFYDTAFLLRHRWLSVIQVELGLKAGTITPAQGTEWLTENGYPADQVAAFVSGAAGGGTVKTKADTLSMIEQMYSDHLFTEAEALQHLVTLGYDADSAGMIISLVDAKRALSQTTTAVSAVRSAYLARRITLNDASKDLDALHIPAQARDTWLDAWSVELGTKHKELTAAQIGGMFKKGILTLDYAIAEWEAMGYSHADAVLLGYDYGATLPGGKPVN